MSTNIKALLLFFALHALFFPAFAQTALKPEWLLNARSYFNGGDMQVKDITELSDGSVVAVGSFTHTVDFDPSPDTFNLTAISPRDVFVVKYSNNGQLRYAYRFGGNNAVFYQTATAIAVDNDNNIYISGTFGGTADFNPGGPVAQLTAEYSGEIFILSLSSAGDFRYAINVADTPGADKIQAANAITVDKDKNVYITGQFAGRDIDFDPGPDTLSFSSGTGEDIFFAKYDALGQYVFVKVLPGNNADYGKAIALDADKNIIIGCSINSTQVDADPGPGIVNVGSLGRDDILFAKYDSLGNYIWAKKIGGDRYDGANSLAVDKSNNIIVTGYFRSVNVDFDPGADVHLLTPINEDDCFVAKYDTNGNYLFAFGIGDQGYDAGTRVQADDDNNVYVLGRTNTNNADFDPGAATYTISNGNFYFAKYSPAGSFIYAKAIGELYSDAVNSLYVSRHGRVTMGGYYNGSIDVDATANVVNLTAPSTTGFMVKYDNSGNYINSISAQNYINYLSSASIISATAADSSGNTYIAGTLNGTFDIDPGPGLYLLQSPVSANITFFAKYDKNNNMQLVKVLDGSVNASDIAIDNTGNIYLTGIAFGYTDFDPSDAVRHWTTNDTITNNYNGGFFFAKYDTTGNLVFANGGGELYGRYSVSALAIDSKQNIYLTGSFKDPLDFNPAGKRTRIKNVGLQDIFVAKYNPSGKLSFVNTFGAATNSYNKGTDIKVNSKNEIIVTGEYATVIDFDPGAGVHNLDAGTSFPGGFLAGYKSDGSFLFAVNTGATTTYIGSAPLSKLVLDAKDRIYIGGVSDGSFDFDPGAATVTIGKTGMFFAAYNADGSYRFVKGILNFTNSDVQDNAIGGIAVDKNNNIYIAGRYGSLDIDCDPDAGEAIITNSFYQTQYYIYQAELFTAKYDSLGNYINSYHFASDSVAGLNSVSGFTVDADGMILFAGNAVSKIDFDPGTGTNFFTPTAVQNNLFMARLQQTSACAPPYNTGTGSIKINSAKLHWSYGTNSAGFEIQYRAANSSVWLIARAAGNARTKIITNLIPASQYVWKIRSDCGSETSAFSDSLVFTTKAAVTVAAVFAESLNTTVITKVYPNPATDRLYLQLQNLQQRTGNALVKLYDTKGSCVFTTTVAVIANSINAAIKLPSSLSKCTYFIQVNTAGHLYKSSFLKQ